MNTLGNLEMKLLNGEITEEEYKKKKTIYVELIFELYCLDLISKEEMYEKLNK